MDFTGLSVLALLFWESVPLQRFGGFLRFDRGCLETPGVRQKPRTARDDEGMVTVFLRRGNMFLLC